MPIILTTNTAANPTPLNGHHVMIETEAGSFVQIRQVFGATGTFPTAGLPNCQTEIIDCLPVIEDYNDKSYFLFEINDPIVFAQAVLQKYVSGVWTDIETPFGASGQVATTGTVTRFFGVRVDWDTVAASYGLGQYRLVFCTLLFSHTFVLLADSCENANRTVKLKAKIGSFIVRRNERFSSTEAIRAAFGDAGAWYEEVRHYGFIDPDEGSPVTIEQTFLERIREDRLWQALVRNQYTLQLDKVSKDTFDRTIYFIFGGFDVTVTDYNLNSTEYLTDYKVKFKGDTSFNRFFNHKKIFTAKIGLEDITEQGMRTY